MMTMAACSDVDLIEPAPSTIEVPSADVKDLNIVDKSATPETKALYANLWKIQQTGFMFGHHDDLTYGRYWQYEEGQSDTKAVCGDYPGVYGVDLAEVMDDRSDSQKEVNAIRRRCIIDARRRGMVVLVCAHLDNPLTGGDAWDNTSNQVAKEILTDGSATQKKFNGWLDRFAAFLEDLRDDQGQPIPMVFRPFHEHTQSWAWWGNQCTTEQEFIALWRYTVDYLRNAGVHQLIYAISPQMDSPKAEEDFLYRWPGDDYVDFIGMDCYNGGVAATLSVNLRMMQSVAAKKHKPCGVTEMGVESFTDAKYWTQQVLAPAEGRKVSMIVTWRNKFVNGDETDKHYFSVYPGHPSEADFVRFYNDGQTLFSQDLPDMYKLPADMKVE
ncbi:glycoside hydrolase family 26 protein [Prevotella sp. KH2C16]|uniref:glycoside hydrolase family 26 protein n=1 Tax=Prevotella sp. KH2C16 TaxID=1855325 RepID=UPI0015A573D6|nr:glycosyl hydrolase [Prevotella sp. KH2C16]